MPSAKVDGRAGRLAQVAVRWLGAGVVVVVGWWSLLGWDARQAIGADGELDGPYDPWQIVAMVALLGVLAVWMGYRGVVVGGSATAALVLAICFGICAVRTPSTTDSLWPVQAVALFVGGFIGMTVVSAVVWFAQRRVGSR